VKVEFRDVVVELGGRRVVDGVSLTVNPGKVIGLLGPNGSGKSTLLRTLYRAIVPRTGTVSIDDRDVRAMRPKAVAQAVAVMLQDPQTEFDLTVNEFVLLGRIPHHSSFGRDTAEDLRLVQEAMDRAGVAELAGRPMGSLSGGQRQRAMLARALAQQTPVLVLDEPSNHLDIRHQLELMAEVRVLGRTVIAALHDLNLAAEHCDEVVILDRGRAVAAGPPAEVLTPALVRLVFGVDARTVGDANDSVLAFRRLGAPSCPLADDSSSAAILTPESELSP
jgi:iron complex transport system ATP-binding protein